LFESRAMRIAYKKGGRDSDSVLVGLLFCLGVILYLDRAALSVLASSIRKDLGLDPLAMGWIFSAFVLGYTLLQVPSGWLADLFGPPRFLTRIVLLWSAFTAATAVAWSFSSLFVARFLFGATESGATPSASLSIALGVRPEQRARAQGIYLAGMSAGAMLAPPLATLLLLHFGWRIAFVAIGGLGTLWAASWHVYHPERSFKYVPQAQRQDIDWRNVLTEPNLWAILMMYFTYGYTGYIYITWFPTYLLQSRHLSLGAVGVLASVPSALGLLAKPLGGWWSDCAAQHYGLVFGRRLVGMLGFALGAAAVLPGLLVANPVAGALLLGLADGSAALAHGVCFAVCLDVGERRAATVSALMLMAGSVGNITSALAFGAFLHFTGSWMPPFLLAMAANVIGSLLWLKIDPGKKLV
jgi:predicted MFS family arabinose efflux permease